MLLLARVLGSGIQVLPSMSRVSTHQAKRGPVVATPFERMGIIIVGPFPKAAGGHTHILVLVDYATCYPEAVTFCSTTASMIT